VRPILLVLLLLAPLALAGHAAAQTTREYDAQGRSVGRNEQRGDTVREYDAQGRSVGRAEQRGDTIRRYDAQGRAVGRSGAPLVSVAST
jgi:YD repeat-containing protein